MTRIEQWACGWVEIACGLVTVLTLAHCTPRWEMDFCSWCVRRKCETNLYEGSERSKK